MDTTMGLGWKVIAGAICLGVGQLLSALITDCPVPAWVPWIKWFSGGFNACGMVLAGIGVSSKVATAVNTVTNSVASSQRAMSKAMGEQKFIEKVIEKRVPYIVKRLGPNDELMVKKNVVEDKDIINLNKECPAPKRE
jgi:hypothetical protein